MTSLASRNGRTAALAGLLYWIANALDCELIVELRPRTRLEEASE